MQALLATLLRNPVACISLIVAFILGCFVFDYHIDNKRLRAKLVEAWEESARLEATLKLQNAEIEAAAKEAQRLVTASENRALRALAKPPVPLPRPDVEEMNKWFATSR